MNILDEIAEKTRKRIEAEKAAFPLEEIKQKIQEKQGDRKQIESGYGRFYRAIKKEGMSFICEIKKASPSKGVIAEEFPYIKIAKEYEAAGANAISCLTEPEYFRGSNQILEEVAAQVDIPILKKDFTIDPYMIYQGKYYGASAILLICGILTDEELKAYRELAEELGMDALVEAHNQEEILRACKSGARIIGVNNRNLKDFTVDMENTKCLRQLVPKDVLFISESGIKNRQDVMQLEEMNVNGVLIGETLMRSSDKAAKLRELAG